MSFVSYVKYNTQIPRYIDQSFFKQKILSHEPNRTTNYTPCKKQSAWNRETLNKAMQKASNAVKSRRFVKRRLIRLTRAIIIRTKTVLQYNYIMWDSDRNKAVQS